MSCYKLEMCRSNPGGVCSRGVWSWGISQHALRQTPLCPVDILTVVEILPWPNFVAAGNDTPSYLQILVMYDFAKSPSHMTKSATSSLLEN